MIRKSIILFLFISLSFGENENGEDLYRKGKFQEAQDFYLKKSMERGTEPEIQFGYGASSFKLEKIDEAVKAFEAASETDDPLLKSKAFYNLGNGYYQKQDYEKSLESYKKALAINPFDVDAKANFEILKRQMEQEEQEKNEDQEEKSDDKQDQKNQNESNEKQDKNSDGDKQDQNEQDQEQDDQSQKNKENSQDQEDKKQEEQEQQDPKPEDGEKKKNTPEYRNAEAILNSLKKDEQINQKRQIARGKTRKMEKDW